MIAAEINDLNDICHQYTKDKIKETLRVNTNMSDTEIHSFFQSLQESDLHAACSCHLSTEYTSRHRITLPMCSHKMFTWGPMNIEETVMHNIYPCLTL